MLVTLVRITHFLSKGEETLNGSSFFKGRPPSISFALFGFVSFFPVELTGHSLFLE